MVAAGRQTTAEETLGSEPQLDTELSFAEFSAGLRGLSYIPPILFRRRNWDELVMRGGLCDGGGKLNQQGFARLLKQAVWRFQLGELSLAMDAGGCKEWDPRSVRAALQSLKGVLTIEYEGTQEEEVIVAEMAGLGGSYNPSPCAARGPAPVLGTDNGVGYNVDLQDLVDGLGSVCRGFASLEQELVELREATAGKGAVVQPAKAMSLGLPPLASMMAFFMPSATPAETPSEKSAGPTPRVSVRANGTPTNAASGRGSRPSESRPADDTVSRRPRATLSLTRIAAGADRRTPTRDKSASFSARAAIGRALYRCARPAARIGGSDQADAEYERAALQGGPEGCPSLSPTNLAVSAVAREPLRDMMALLGHEAITGGRIFKRLSDVGEELLGSLLGPACRPAPASGVPLLEVGPGTPPESPSSPRTPRTESMIEDDRSPLVRPPAPPKPPTG